MVAGWRVEDGRNGPVQAGTRAEGSSGADSLAGAGNSSCSSSYVRQRGSNRERGRAWEAEQRASEAARACLATSGKQGWQGQRAGKPVHQERGGRHHSIASPHGAGVGALPMTAEKGEGAGEREREGEGEGEECTARARRAARENDHGNDGRRHHPKSPASAYRWLQRARRSEKGKRERPAAVAASHRLRCWLGGTWAGRNAAGVRENA